jgi:hypothetical protein
MNLRIASYAERCHSCEDSDDPHDNSSEVRMAWNRDRIGGWIGLVTASVMLGILAVGGIYGFYSLGKLILRLFGVG